MLEPKRAEYAIDYFELKLLKETPVNKDIVNLLCTPASRKQISHVKSALTVPSG